MASLADVKLEVGGFQAFICQTGKLKEMIGDSEMISALAGSFYENIRQQLSLNAVMVPLSSKPVKTGSSRSRITGGRSV